MDDDTDHLPTLPLSKYSKFEAMALSIERV